MGMKHFSNIYKAPRGTSITKILRIAKVLSRFVEKEEVEGLNIPVSIGELEENMKCFKKEKSLASDVLAHGILHLLF